MKDWKDSPDEVPYGSPEATPITAAELERIETDIASAATAAEVSVTAVGGFSSRVAGAETRITATENDITALQTGKADTLHGHQQSQIAGLSEALDGKAPTQHQHVGADISSGVVKTVNGTAPDGAGDVAIPSITASTAKGALLAGQDGGAWGQLPPRPVGTDTHVLVLDSRAPVGVAWATATAPLVLPDSVQPVTFAAPSVAPALLAGGARSASRTTDGNAVITAAFTPLYSGPSSMPPFGDCLSLADGEQLVATLPPAMRPTSTRTITRNYTNPNTDTTQPLAIRTTDNLMTASITNVLTIRIKTDGAITVQATYLNQYNLWICRPLTLSYQL